MALRFCVLGSGSSGNCVHVATDTTALLIDAGLSGRETIRRLEVIGAVPASLSAVCVSHEHSDHIAGLAVLRSRLNLDLYANAATIEAVERNLRRHGMAWRVFTTGSPFQVGDITVNPFSVCHDAYDPVGFAVESAGVRIGVVTDIGKPTALVRERLKNCRAIIIEANHSEEMLRDSARPWRLKQRIAGRQGHLSNRHAAELVAEVAGPQLSHVFLAHLSADCNRPDIAVRSVEEALRSRGLDGIKVSPTFQDRPGEVWVSG